MNFRSIIRAAAIATVMLTSTALASNDDYKTVTVSATETKLLTTALATDANYDSSEDKRICFTAIDKLKQKATDNNTTTNTTKYKFYVKGCAVESAKTGAGQCASGTCATPLQYKVKLIVQTASGSVKVDDIDRDEDGSADSDDTDDSDMSDSSDWDDNKSKSSSETTSVTGTSGNSTSTAGASGAAAATSGSSSSTSATSSTTVTKTPSSTTATPTSKTSTKAPSSGATGPTRAGSALAATAAVSVTLAIAAAL